MTTTKDPATLDAEYFSKAANVARRVIPAGQTVNIDAYGAAYHLISSTGNNPILIATGTTPEVPVLPGSGQGFPRYFRFSTLQVRNTAAYDVQIVLWYGFGEYTQNTFYLSSNPSFPLPVVSTQIAATSGVSLTGNPPANAIRRRSVVVSNLDPANYIEVYDKAPASGGVPLLTVFARTVIEYESDAALYIHNPNGAAVPCRVAETWLKL